MSNNDNYIGLEDAAEYERVQGIVLDTRYLLKNYDGNHDADRAALSVVIA